MRTGIAHIPLDYGTCPRWLFEKMTRLGRLITEAVVYEFGPEEFISRMSNPFFFQSLGAILGFDWNSSGLTTTVCGALKYALRGAEKDLGIFIAGGKGKTSRKTPQQIEEYGLKFGFKFMPDLIYASKMSAKVDSAALQDGFALYHHTFFFTNSGNWSVIQQGMNTDIKRARRYHWHAEIPHKHSGQAKLDFINEPHSAVCSDVKVKPLNLVAEESEKTRDYSVGLIKENFNALLRDLKKVSSCHPEPFDFSQDKLREGSHKRREILRSLSLPQNDDKKKRKIQKLPILDLPSDHNSPLPYLPFDYKRVEKILYKAKEQDFKNYEDLLGRTNVGPATLRALALVSEIIYGAKPSYRDPVRYSFAYGGKDGYPYPVDREEYEKSINILNRAITKAKIGQREKLAAFKKLAR